MAKRLDEAVDEMIYDGLIVDNFPTAKVAMIQLAASQGVLERGSLVTGTPGGEMSLAAAAISATNTAFILCDKTDTGTGSAVVAVGYRTGHFNRNAVKVGASYTLSAADETALRRLGILLSDALEYTPVPAESEETDKEG